MKTADIVGFLDEEFRVSETADPEMTKHALTDQGRAFVLPAFHEKKTGLMFDFAESVDRVYCVTFVTAETLEEVLAGAEGPGLLFTHHPFDYHEDERGLGPVADASVRELRDRQIAVYAIHAPLDVGRTISVSRSLARRLALSNTKPFYPSVGGHLGAVGEMPVAELHDMARAVGHALELQTVDVFDNGGGNGPTAVVAGGGDQTQILNEAMGLGCTTYVTGTVVHRWDREPVKKGNRKFHEVARASAVSLIGATHYNTEKCAVQEVAALLAQHGIPATFVEDPVLRRYENGNFRVQ